jgi:hypothetical protein
MIFTKGYSVAYQPKTYQDFINAAYAKYIEYLSYELPNSQGAQSSIPAEVPVKVIEITTERIPKQPKVTPRSKLPSDLLIWYRYALNGSVAIEEDSTSARSIESLRASYGIDITDLVYVPSDGLMARIRVEYGFDEFETEGTFTTATDGANKISEDNLRDLVVSGDFLAQLKAEIKDFLPIQASDLGALFQNLDFTRLSTQQATPRQEEFPLDLGLLLVDGPSVNFNYEVGDVANTSLNVDVNISEVTLAVGVEKRGES